MGFTGIEHYKQEYGEDGFMDALEDIVFDREYLEAPCSVCGTPIYPLEPDADTAWCEVCNKVQPVGNVLIEMGIM